MRNDKEFVRYLIQRANIHVDEKSFSEQTALQLAKLCNHKSIMSVLQNAGADVEMIDEDYDKYASDDSDLDWHFMEALTLNVYSLEQLWM